MNRILHNVKLAMVTMALALVGLTVAATAGPAAHAAATLTAPTISTSVTWFSGDHSEEATLGVQGSNFTPLGSVLVEVFNSSFSLVYSRTLSASGFASCEPGIRGLICTGGGAFWAGFLFSFPPFPSQTYYIAAYDYGTGRWSNWSSQSI